MNIILDVSFLKQCRESWLKKYIVVVATIIVGYKLVLTCVIKNKKKLYYLLLLLVYKHGSGESIYLGVLKGVTDPD